MNTRMAKTRRKTEKRISHKAGKRTHLTVHNLQKVLSVTSKLNTVLDVNKLLGIIMTTASEVIQAEAASLMLIDEPSNELVFKVALGSKGTDLQERFRVRMGEGIAGTVAQSGRSLIVNHPLSDKRFARRFDEVTGFGTKAILCVPLRIKEKIIGVLEAFNPLDGRGFTQSDRALFETFADQAALAVESARLHHEAVRQEKAQQELRIAHDIQQHFLPNLDEARLGIDIAARSIPAREVGGDFYDVVSLDSDRTAIVIGDVSGKGVPAALYMVRAISEYRFRAPLRRSASDLLSSLNEILAKESRFGMFVTLLYLLVDRKRKTLQCASAGHHPILERKKTGGLYPLKSSGDPPLGLMEGVHYEEITLSMEPESIYLLYTDGVTEARNPSGEEFGLRKLEAVLSENHPTAGACVDAILQKLREFTKDAPPHDDITLLALKTPNPL